MPPPNPLLQAALEYAARGWHVFPLKPRGKTPLIPKERGGRGLYDATTDPAQIHSWWALYPQANVGIRTGACSGLVVIDADCPEAEAAYVALRLPFTPTVKTPRGHHYYLAHPGGTVPNQVRAAGGPAFDVRGDGGYVVAPPSIHPSGEPYTREPGSEPQNGATLPTAPVAVKTQAPALREPTTAPPAPQRPLVAHAGNPWAETALKAECFRVSSAQPGARNHTLNRAAFALGQIVAGGHLERERVEAELRVAAERSGLLEADGAGQIGATIESGLKAGALEPRHPEPGHGAPGPLATATAEREAHHRTDVGNAERLAARYGHELRYLHPWREWLVWDGRRWARDRSGELVRRARETIRALYSESAGIRGDDDRRELAKHALASEAQRRIFGMIELAKADERIAALPEHFDGPSSRYLLNLPNGTLELTSGTLKPHEPRDLLTRIGNASFDPVAACPAWDAFLARVVPDGEVRAFLQRFTGYALSGDVSEQVFCLLHGSGANGKSTFLETILHLLGEYGHAASFESFLEATSKSDRRGGPRADLLALRGVRLVAAIEAGEGRRLDENVIKQLTGRDSITARGMYQAEETTFSPEAKLLLAGNHEPEIHGGDLAIWRRVLEVPFTITIPEDERDPDLLDRLRSPGEMSGILNWALMGCRAWLAMGSAPRLRPPASVISATRRYRDEQDRLRPFFDDCCILGPAEMVTNGALRQAYENWCKANGDRPVGTKRVARKLKEMGIEVSKIGSTRRWLGIGLIDRGQQIEQWS
jgi:putative DNA primase/helicase